MTWLTPEKPLSFILRDKMPSLKNNRILKTNPKSGKVQSIPQGDVIKAIRNIKTAINRQMPDELKARGYPLVSIPSEVFLIVRLGVYYLSELPNSDVDNAVTTIQEAMADIVYENDRQVGATSQRRFQFKSDLALHTKVFIWCGDPNCFERDVVMILEKNNLI